MRHFGRPVSEQPAQSDVFVNDAQRRGDRSAGEIRVVDSLRRQPASEVWTTGDLPYDLLGRVTRTRVTGPAKLLDLVLGRRAGRHGHHCAFEPPPTEPRGL